MRTIEVIVNKDGSLKIDAVGFKGADCQKATEFLERALGRVSGKTKKPEFHRKAVHQQQIGGA